MDAVTLARACADAMGEDDATSRALGIELVSVGPGQAVLAMTVTAAMANWHNTCHGGYIYLLADTAFGYACNTRNQRMVAQHCSISYLNPVRRGERLTAHAVERQRQGRSGIYDVAVKRDDGTVVAEFRGHGRVIEGTLVPITKAGR
jgi:acyl-CoA thioesterase